MIKKEIIISIGSLGRKFEHEQSDEIFLKDIKLWREIKESFSLKSYTHESVSAEVITDWSPVIEELEQQHSRDQEFKKTLKEEGEEAAWEVFSSDREEPKVKFLVIIQGESKLSDHNWYYQFFVEKYLYDVFFIINLSLPGACDFFNVRFINERELENERFLLSSYGFEEALYSHLSGIRPSPMCLPINAVLDWYSVLDLGIKQKAESPIEKAIFSLLHLCKSEVDETSVVWIFHALEAIYGTKVGEGFTNLIDRLSNFLELGSKEKGKAKKNLRAMYDYRSALVHGGYKVHHPLRNEVIDKRLNEDYSRIIELFQFGFNLVVLSIQTMIRNNWYGIEVQETLVGIETLNIEE